MKRLLKISVALLHLIATTGYVTVDHHCRMLHAKTLTTAGSGCCCETGTLTDPVANFFQLTTAGAGCCCEPVLPNDHRSQIADQATNPACCSIENDLIYPSDILTISYNRCCQLVSQYHHIDETTSRDSFGYSACSSHDPDDYLPLPTTLSFARTTSFTQKVIQHNFPLLI